MYAILRTYNNFNISDIIRRLDNTGLISSFIVVINADQDNINTEKLLTSLKCSKPIIPILLINYGWSKALNKAICSLPPKKSEQELIMMVSCEVQIDYEEILKLQQLASSDNTSCAYVLFEGRHEPSYCLPRNTCAVWRRKIFEETGLFDESLDAEGGMEDYEMVLRACKTKELLPFLASQKVRISLRSGLNFEKKILSENRTVLKIEQKYDRNLVIKVRNHIKQQNKMPG